MAKEECVMGFLPIFSTARFCDVKEQVHGYLTQTNYPNGDFVLTEFDQSFLKQHVNKITVSDTKLSQHEVD